MFSDQYLGPLDFSKSKATVKNVHLPPSVVWAQNDALQQPWSTAVSWTPPWLGCLGVSNRVEQLLKIAPSSHSLGREKGICCHIHLNKCYHKTPKLATEEMPISLNRTGQTQQFILPKPSPRSMRVACRLWQHPTHRPSAWHLSSLVIKFNYNSAILNGMWNNEKGKWFY